MGRTPRRAARKRKRAEINSVSVLEKKKSFKKPPVKKRKTLSTKKVKARARVKKLTLDFRESHQDYCRHDLEEKDDASTHCCSDIAYNDRQYKVALNRSNKSQVLVIGKKNQAVLGHFEDDKGAELADWIPDRKIKLSAKCKKMFSITICATSPTGFLQH